MQILNLNTKIIENKHFIHHLKWFLQTLSATGHLNAKHLNTITIASVLAHFPGLLSWMQDCFQYKLSPVIHFPCKIAQTRNQTKKQHLLTLKATRSQEHSPLKHHQPTRLFWHVVTGTLRRFASSYSLLYFLEFEWLLFFLKQESLPIISKGKSYLKLSKLIPNWAISD